MDELGQLPPDIKTALPGTASTAYVDLLAMTESPAFTARRARRAEMSGASHDPIVWTEARGANVKDADGNRFVDLTAGFGAAAVGHGHPRVREAVMHQADRLVHALGDVYPSEVKIRLLQRLAELAPFDDARVILGLNGSDAVEAALKTALRATGKAGVLAFDGGYHGLSHGSLAACGLGEAFRRPFAQQLNPHVRFAPFPRAELSRAELSRAELSRAELSRAELSRAVDAVQACWDSAGEEAEIGAVLVEPIQGRGGVIEPPPGFLGELKSLCDKRGAVLIVDEIFTGLGRCGALWLCEQEGVRPDLICAGKALGGGLPISACIGRAEVMAAWGEPGSEALYTGTFFGHPLGCAAALCTLKVIESESLIEVSRSKGERFKQALEQSVASHPRVQQVRGRGLMVGIELEQRGGALLLVRRLLEQGYLTLPAGRHAEVLSLTPPLSIAEELLDGFVAALSCCLEGFE